jgi:alkanesulfonate monooxygenase SsuD/methylene tetrahydromethanopterin reductase-like flavin-dependent oxidoreductase (luciferase family)
MKLIEGALEDGRRAGVRMRTPAEIEDEIEELVKQFADEVVLGDEMEELVKQFARKVRHL